MRTIHVVSSALIPLLVPVLVLSLAASAGAQEPAQVNPAQVKPAHGSGDNSGTVNVDQLPLNMSRIHRQLQRSSERQERDGLNLRFFVAVYAQAPAIQLYTKQDNLSRGPVPYGGPTHADMLQIMTPQEFRAPAADFSGIARWLADRAKK
jgi:hypothetical protein